MTAVIKYEMVLYLQSIAVTMLGDTLHHNSTNITWLVKKAAPTATGALKQAGYNSHISTNMHIFILC